MVLPGTEFLESVKLEARRLAAFKCCYCRDEMGDEVHHLTPKEEGGQGVLDNAIFLCGRCHGLYGHRKDKRKQLRQARDIWYEIVREKYAPREIEKLESLATKQDLVDVQNTIVSLFDTVMGQFRAGTMSIDAAVNVASSIVSSTAYHPMPRHGSYPHAEGAFVFETPMPLRNLRSTEDDPKEEP
jgi:hypothetical protein